MNYLVTPFYPESGGTVIDWMSENDWVSDDEDFNEEDFDDDDLDMNSMKDDENPF
ncbi:MAG: hypothetical protein JNJ43_09785 [Anaerolineales bacterium]|nr:hypothetical protein [Anaerolineales bacterium]